MSSPTKLTCSCKLHSSVFPPTPYNSDPSSFFKAWMLLLLLFIHIGVPKSVWKPLILFQLSLSPCLTALLQLLIEFWTPPTRYCETEKSHALLLDGVTGLKIIGVGLFLLYNARKVVPLAYCLMRKTILSFSVHVSTAFPWIIWDIWEKTLDE